MKTNQTAIFICLCSALGFAVPVGFGQTETNDTSELPIPPVKEQQVEPTPSKEEEAKSPEPQVVWNGEVMIKEQNKLIRKNQDDLIKRLQGIVPEIQKSNKELEQSIKAINQQQASLAAQLAEVSKNLDQNIERVRANTEQSANILNKSLNGLEAKVEQLSSQIVDNQEEYSGLLSELTDRTGLTNEGVNENKTLLGEIQSENSQLQEKISSLENEIGRLKTEAKENHEKVQGALGSISSKLVLSFVLKTIVILAAFGLGFYVWKNKQMIAALITGKNNSDQVQFESIFNDERYLDGLNRVVDLLNATGQAGAAQEQDHGLPRSVADEINRMRNRLRKMEREDVKVKPLQKALERMEEKLESMGYEIVDLKGEPYVDGMTANPIMIPSDDLKSGEQIITRVISPQVRFQGKLIQVPEIEVSIGE